MATDMRRRREAQVEIGTASASAFVFDDAGTTKHGALTIHADGSGSITIYRNSGLPTVRQQARLSLSREDFLALHRAISAFLMKETAA